MSTTLQQSQRDASHRDLPTTQDPLDPSIDNTFIEDRLCPGCKKSVVTEHGGLVVAFGQSFFHVDCFKCAKCGNQVNADTNLLLLSDGSPICANCSYSCNVCHLPILDEAIMTGDDSYHAHCFKCKVCDTRIDELVFAKTSHGIYCMNCHNKRMIKLREHAQKKAERAKEKAAANGSTSTKSRERDPKIFHQENGAVGGLTSPGLQLQPTPTSNPSSNRNSHVATRSPAKPPPGVYVSDAFTNTPQTASSIQPSTSSNSSFSMTIAPPLETMRSAKSFDQDRPNALKQNTLPVPNPPFSTDPDSRRRSYDDGVRPLNVLFGSKGDPNQHPPLLSAPASSNTTSRRDKRRSINPAISLSELGLLADASAMSPSETSVAQDSLSANSSRYDKRPSINPIVSLSEFGVSSTLSPHSPATIGPPDRIPVSPGGRHSPGATSPFQEHFNISIRSPTLPTQGTSRLNDIRRSRSPSYSENGRQDQSRSESPSRMVDDDQTIVIKSPPSITVGSAPPPKNRPRAAGHDNQEFSSSVSPRDRSRNSSSSLGPNDFEHGRTSDGRQTPGSRPLSGSLSLRSPIRSRSVSPSHRADVPSGVESEPDTDGEPENTTRAKGLAPLYPPTKQDNAPSQQRSLPFSESYLDPESSLASPDSEDFSESSPVERTSHSTYIAPALPPIRISMNTADFSELLNSVGGFPSLKSLDHFAKISERPHTRGDASTRPAPPPSSTSAIPNANDLTPKNVSIPIPPAVEGEKRKDGQQGQSTDKSVSQPSQSPSVPHKPAQPPPVFSRPNGSNHSAGLPPSATSSSVESATLNGSHESGSTTRITLTEPESTSAKTLAGDTNDIVLMRLQEALVDAKERGAQQLKMDRSFVEAIFATLDSTKLEYEQLKSRFDGMKRTSKQYIDGLSVAQGEYDRELKARRDAEAEVTRLRVLLSGQVARLTAMSGEARKDELRQRMSKEIHANLTGLEQDLSNLRVERDMALAEVEELSASRSAVATSPELPSVIVSRSLTKRFDSIKNKYRGDLIPLTKEKEILTREIAELKAVRDVFLEETTVLNARNEELAQLSAVYSRRVESGPEPQQQTLSDNFRSSLDRNRANMHYLPPSLSTSTSTSSAVNEDGTLDHRYMRVQKPEIEHQTPSKKFMKWPGSKSKEILVAPPLPEKKAPLEHNFQQLSVLRFTRCDHCGDKMWGSQLRCTICPTSIHMRCIGHMQIPCVQPNSAASRSESPPGQLPPSMFGRDLVEQVHADAREEERERQVPVIVEKCIDAVEALAMDYEGIYRKSGGSGQSKMITQLFERGNYTSFDLKDSERFNDICSVTSVLKNYFRSLPVPLLTFDLHDEFMTAVHAKDTTVKYNSLLELVNKLPNEHYFTLKMLMSHLNRIRDRCEKNLMTARNLGVVFGPTLMRSRDPSAEFSDMAGKALSVEWLVENAPTIFTSR